MTKSAHLTDSQRKVLAPIIIDHVVNNKALDVKAIMKKPCMLRTLMKDQLKKCIESEVRMVRTNFVQAARAKIAKKAAAEEALQGTLMEAERERSDIARRLRKQIEGRIWKLSSMRQRQLISKRLKRRKKQNVNDP